MLLSVIKILTRTWRILYKWNDLNFKRLLIQVIFFSGKSSPKSTQSLPTQETCVFPAVSGHDEGKGFIYYLSDNHNIGYIL